MSSANQDLASPPPSSPQEARRLRVERLGLVSYAPTVELQIERHRRVFEETCDDTLFLLEHHSVITTGRNTGNGSILVSKAELEQTGVDLFETGRGGDATYHGPGQVVGYPIIKLQESEKDVRRFVWNLEEVLIRTACDYGILAQRIDGLRGIWVGNDKLAAIGVRLSRWTTMHGFAFNVSTDLRYFDLILPCGIRDRGVTSLERLSGRKVESKDVEKRLMVHMANIFERKCYYAEDDLKQKV